MTGPVPLATLDRFVLPAGEPGMAAYLLERLLAPHNLRQRLRRSALLSAPALAARLVARRPVAGDGHRPALEMVAAALGDQGPLRGTPLAGRPMRWLLVEDYAGHGRERLVLFLFGDGDRSPVAVAKLRREDGPGRPLAHEAEALRLLAGRLPADLRRTVPRVLASRVSGGLEALVMEPLPGVSAYVEMQGLLAPGRAVERHLEAAADWLGRFQRATRLAGRAWAAEQVLAELVERDGEVPGLGRLRAELAGCRLPLVAAHGDFWARNLLVGPGGEAAVVDWEHFAAAASPFEDLFHFALTYGLEYPWGRWRRLPPLAAFRRTFLEPNRVSRAVARFLGRAAAGAGIDPGLLRPLLHLYLLTRPAGRLPWRELQRQLAEAA